jgi:hypothetical protein
VNRGAERHTVIVHHLCAQLVEGEVGIVVGRLSVCGEQRSRITL